MSSTTIGTSIRRVMIATLVGATAFGAWRIGSGQTDGFALAETRLSERMDEYVALRMEDDQEGIYHLMDPEQRKIKNKREFLLFYGSGILKPLSFVAGAINIDQVSQSATVVVESTVQLIPKRLPKPFDTLNEEHPEHLRRQATDELRWIWREGDWYLRMAREFITGRAADGRAVEPIAPDAFPNNR